MRNFKLGITRLRDKVTERAWVYIEGDHKSLRKNSFHDPMLLSHSIKIESLSLDEGTSRISSEKSSEKNRNFHHIIVINHKLVPWLPLWSSHSATEAESLSHLWPKIYMFQSAVALLHLDPYCSVTLS
jgi:hypothetical protein